MSNEQIHEIMAALLIVPTSKVNGVSFDKIAKGLGELLAYREAQGNPVAYIDNDELERLADSDSGVVRTPNFGAGYQSATIPLFTAPQSPVWFGVDWAAPQLPAVPDEHAEFELFMSERFGDLINIRRAKNGDNEYMAWDVAVAWIAWKQRAILKSASFRETDNSSTKHFRESAETSTNCPKCGGRGTYHCHQMLGTVECECALAVAPKPPATENK